MRVLLDVLATSHRDEAKLRAEVLALRRQVPASPAGLETLADNLAPDEQVVLESTVNTWAAALES